MVDRELASDLASREGAEDPVLEARLDTCCMQNRECLAEDLLLTGVVEGHFT